MRVTIRDTYRCENTTTSRDSVPDDGSHDSGSDEKPSGDQLRIIEGVMGDGKRADAVESRSNVTRFTGKWIERWGGKAGLECVTVWVVGYREVD